MLDKIQYPVNVKNVQQTRNSKEFPQMGKEHL